MTKSAPQRIVWYDTETTGRSPQTDRIVRLAYIETDKELRAIWEGEWQILLDADVLPSLDALLLNRVVLSRNRLYPPWTWNCGDEGKARITSIPSDFELGIVRKSDGPDLRRCSLSDHELAQALAWLFHRHPGIVQAGFNSVKFDDEFVRFTLYRNLYDPYSPRWPVRGSSRLDALNMIRAVSIASPDAMRWPTDDDGVPSYKLEDLAAENDVEFLAHAHDALSDARATLALAQMVKRNATDIWMFAIQESDRNSVESRLQDDLNDRQDGTLMHVSENYGNARRCAAPIVTVCKHPRYRNWYVIIDLAHDPTVLLDTHPSDIRDRLYKKTEDLEADDETRPPLGHVALTKAPLVLRNEARTANQMSELAGYNMTTVLRHREIARRHKRELQRICNEVFDIAHDGPPRDAEQSLYDGKFPSNHEKLAIQDIRERILARERPSSADIRQLPEKYQTLAMRMMTRMRPDLLSNSQRERWKERVRGWYEDGFGTRPSAADLKAKVQRRGTASPEEQRVLNGIMDHIGAGERGQELTASQNSDTWI